MSAKSSIEWTDVTWNPVRGCSLVSAGCQNCYAMKMAYRFSGKGKPYEGLTELGTRGPRWNGKINQIVKALSDPVGWKKPRRVFVNSMSDLFHEDVSDDFIYRVFLIMARCSQHTFQILTKRPERMNNFCRRISYIRKGFNDLSHRSCSYWPNNPDKLPIENKPLPNVWLGVSAEDQATADERIPLLLQTPAAVRFISAEPLLGPMDLSREYLTNKCGGKYPFASLADEYRTKHIDLLDWVIVGGESGSGARPTHPAWVHHLRDQCVAAEVPFFFKQWGQWAPISQMANGDTPGCSDYHRKARSVVLHPDGQQNRTYPPGAMTMLNVGKKLAGARLDGMLYRDFPKVPA